MFVKMPLPDANTKGSGIINHIEKPRNWLIIGPKSGKLYTLRRFVETMRNIRNADRPDFWLVTRFEMEHCSSSRVAFVTM